MRKTIFTAAVLAGFSASTAFAGGLSEPVMEPEIIIEGSTGSSGDFVIPLLLLALVAAVATAD